MENSPYTYYTFLGVADTASQEEIKRAYKKKAMLWHPDRNPGEVSEEQFKTLGEAYKVLSDPESRHIYDQYLHDCVYNDVKESQFYKDTVGKKEQTAKEKSDEALKRAKEINEKYKNARKNIFNVKKPRNIEDYETFEDFAQTVINDVHKMWMSGSPFYSESQMMKYILRHKEFDVDQAKRIISSAGGLPRGKKKSFGLYWGSDTSKRYFEDDSVKKTVLGSMKHLAMDWVHHKFSHPVLDMSIGVIIGIVIVFNILSSVSNSFFEKSELCADNDPICSLVREKSK